MLGDLLTMPGDTRCRVWERRLRLTGSCLSLTHDVCAPRDWTPDLTRTSLRGQCARSTVCHTSRIAQIAGLGGSLFPRTRTRLDTTGALTSAGHVPLPRHGSPDPMMQWIRHQLQATGEVSPSTRLELLEIVNRLAAMDTDAKAALVGWQKIKDTAPRVFDAIRPVLQTVAGKYVKKQLGL